MQFAQPFRIVFALLILGFVIFFHELGHFTSCKLFGIRTPVFSVGFGPALIQKKIGQTTFQISMLPFGGYVSMNAYDMNQAPYWQKMIITLAGIINNFLLSWLLLFIVFYLNRRRLKPIISRIIAKSPAASSDLEIGDRIVRINNELIHESANQVLKTIQENPNKELLCTIDRNGTILEMIIPIGIKGFAGSTIGYLGAIFSIDPYKKTSLLQVTQQTLATFFSLIKKSFYFIITIFRPQKRLSSSGPTPIFGILMQNLQKPLTFLLYFIAIISIELGVFNVMPIPMLDGGQALNYTLDAFAQILLPEHSQILIHFIYLILFVALLLYLNRRAAKK